MPQRRRLPQISNYEKIPQNPEGMLIQKSNPLQSLSETKMTLSEFKILDAYLSRIDSHKPDKRYVRFEKGELEKLLGIDRINKVDLEKRINNLFQVVTIRDKRKPNKFTKVALFAKAECEQDENGKWQVTLACSAEAMEYVFNIENIGYLKYRLKNVIDLTSRYSYVLYLYLENNRYRKSWKIPLDELKILLRCTADTYAEYKRFNDLILKKCHNELNDKTSLKYSYKPVKNGRKVAYVEFRLEDFPNIDEPKPREITGQSDTFSDSDVIDFWNEACDNEFTRAEMVQLSEVLRLIPSDKFSAYVNTGIDMQRYHYLAEKYAAMCRSSEKRHISKRFSYMLTILKKDAAIKQ